MPAADLAAWLVLAGVTGLGPETFRVLHKAFGDPEAICAQTESTLANVVRASVAAQIVARRARAEDVEKALIWADAPGNHVVTLGDVAYPQPLLETADPPILLYAKGDLTLLQRRAIAIVGSRNATPQGIDNAYAFARALSSEGFPVVSGLALGIDTAAHRGGLEGPGKTVAVLGTGIDVVYPARNHTLAHRIAAEGCIVSEFPLGTPSKAFNFPRRNRLISGLSCGCLVVEAAMQSGSLITARLAGEQGRDVFAIPGSIHSPLSKGCHALIKQGAKLVDSAADILDELGVATLPCAANPMPQAEGATHRGFLEHLGYDACDVDTLSGRSGLTPAAVSAMLLELELGGQVVCLPGGRYQRRG